MSDEWVALFWTSIGCPRKLIGCALNFAAKFSIAKEAILNVSDVEPITTVHDKRSNATNEACASLFDVFQAAIFLWNGLSHCAEIASVASLRFP